MSKQQTLKYLNDQIDRAILREDWEAFAKLAKKHKALTK